MPLTRRRLLLAAAAVPALAGLERAGGSLAGLARAAIRAARWLIVAGVLAFGGLVFTLSVLILPMQEPEAH